jgi:hypothetical protein
LRQLESALPVALLVACCGCRGNGARDYMPLAVGNRWDYRVASSTGGSSRQRLTIVGQASAGVFRGAEGAERSLWSWEHGFLSVQRASQRIYLLALPAARGTSWWTVTPEGRRVWCTVRAPVQVRVPAGVFPRCAEVVMQPDGGRTEIRHWFARGVGWVRYSYGPRDGRPWMVRELVGYSLRPRKRPD